MSDINFCNTKEQLNHLGEVVTGKVDGSPTGAGIDTSTLPYTGQVRKTLPALEGEYEQSITDKEAEADAAIDAYRLLSKGPYTAGITLEDKFQYITYSGESYFAINPPYTTTATTPDVDSNLFAGGYLTSQQLSLYTDITYKASGGNSAVENMVSGVPIEASVGDITSTGNTTWERVSLSTPSLISDFRPFTALNVDDCGADRYGISLSDDAFEYALNTPYDVVMSDGTYLISREAPFPSYKEFYGQGYRTTIALSFDDDDGIMFSIPAGQFAYSWKIYGFRAINAPGKSERARLINVNGSLRGGSLHEIYTFNLSRPVYFSGSIFGNLIVRDVNCYRLSLPKIPGDTAVHCEGNTFMISDIEIIGAFDRLLYHSGSVFKIDGFNISGSETINQANEGIILDGSSCGYIRSGWIEQITDTPNGEGKAVSLNDCNNVTVEDLNIPTGSIFVDQGYDNEVKTIRYTQNNSGTKALNGAIVNIHKSALGGRNRPTDTLDRRYSYQNLVDGNNSGNGKSESPTNPNIDPLLSKTNASFVTVEEDSSSGNFDSGSSSMKVTTTVNNQGIKATATVVPNKVYTFIFTVRKTSGNELSMAPGLNTVAINSGLWSDRSKGASDLEWINLAISVQSSTGVAEVSVVSQTFGVFHIDAFDCYKDFSTFNPSSIG
jgi:hypothetical protein